MPHVKPDDGNCFRLVEIVPHLKDYDVASFDLFDTIVHRRCDLSTIIHRTAEYAARTIHGDNGPIPASAFLAARGHFADSVKAQDELANARNEILLPDLFERAMRPFISDRERRQRLADHLTDYETRNEIAALSVDPDFPEIATALQRSPVDLILITDMYLPRRSIEQILEELLIRRFFSQIYVSADVGVTKHSGKLFNVVSATSRNAAARASRSPLGAPELGSSSPANSACNRPASCVRSIRQPGQNGRSASSR